MRCVAAGSRRGRPRQPARKHRANQHCLPTFAACAHERACVAARCVASRSPRRSNCFVIQSTPRGDRSSSLTIVQSTPYRRLAESSIPGNRLAHPCCSLSSWQRCCQRSSGLWRRLLRRRPARPAPPLRARLLRPRPARRRPARRPARPGRRRPAHRPRYHPGRHHPRPLRGRNHRARRRPHQPRRTSSRRAASWLSPWCFPWSPACPQRGWA